MVDTFKLCVKLIRSDAYRYCESGKRLISLYLDTPGFRFSFWLRVCSFLRNKMILKPFYILSFLMLRHYSYKFGISISSKTQIGKGFYIGHFGGIVVNSNVVIGDNVNISQGVCIGQSNRGEKKGCAILGNEVYIGPGAKIVGKVHVENNVAIGANAVVTKDIPDNAVVGGIPARIISMDGAEGYINRKV